MAAALAVYFSLFEKHDLARGEVGHVIALATSISQAGVVFGYVLGFLQGSPVLAREIEQVTNTEIRLRNGVVIGVHAASFRNVRGRTLLAVIADEISFWRSEESAVPDVEVVRAVMPALAASGGMLVAISTPWRRTGLLLSLIHI